MRHPIHSVRRRPGAPSFPALLAIALLLLCGTLRAQQGDSRGKDFWIVFMTNSGGNGASPSDLRLYLSSNKATNTTITDNTTGQTVNVPLPVANRAVEFNINNIFGNDLELIPPRRSGTEYSKRSIHITADDEISLYGCSVQVYSADAFLALPVDVLSGSYIVMAYPNTATTTLAFDTPSEFAVVATEDGTHLTIAPKIVLQGHGNANPFTVDLNKGEVFFAQARIGQAVAQDVSGTEVQSNKPVAVFGGVERCSVPFGLSNYRDHLCEQIPPLGSWGKRAIVTPHFPINPGVALTAKVHVLAAFDGTTWTIDGVGQTGLSRGEIAEIELTRAMSIEANQPILVAQYEHSADVTSTGGNFSLGDPFMMLIPPPEQFDTAYAFQSVNHPEFSVHYINIVIPSNAVASIRLDSSPIITSFSKLGGTAFSWAQVRLTAGAHFIRADSAFGLYAYGFGPANSYGYPGGTLIRVLVKDFQAPLITGDVRCRFMEGLVSDDRITDTGIDSLYQTDDSRNVKLTIPIFARGADSVPYRADLIDPFQDGIAGIKALDSIGNAKTQLDTIPGFTLRTVGMTGDGPLIPDTLVIFNGGLYCRTFEVENYGGFTHTIDSVWVGPDSGGMVTISTPVPITVKPGEKQQIRICVNAWGDSLGTLNLYIREDCSMRTVAAIPVVGAIDTLPPSDFMSSKPCGDEVSIAYIDAPQHSSGIMGMTIDTVINGQGSYSPSDSLFPVSQVQLQLHRVDPRQDMIYQVTIVDAAGNRRVKRDTIGGFTLAMVRDPLDTSGGKSFGTVLLGASPRCDSVSLYNFGDRPLEIQSARMFHNVTFSVPPSQFPLTIAPHDTLRVEVCYAAGGVGDDLDTLAIEDGCGHNESLMMKSTVYPTELDGRDRCNNALSVNLLAPAKRTFLQTPVPNPVAGSTVSVDIGLSADASITLDLVDSRGEPAKQILQNIDLKGGINRVRFDVAGLPGGAYFCRMVTSDGTMLVEKLVVAP